MEKILTTLLLMLLALPTPGMAGTISQQPNGWAFPYWYGYSNGASAAYYLAAPTLSANDTATGIAATQTLTNKTLTSPVINGSTTTSGVGAKAATNVTVAEYGSADTIHKTVLTMAATPITLTDEAGVVLYGGQKIYDFPAGNILVLGATINLATTVGGNLSATADGDVGLGTVTADNGATLATTEQNIVPTTSIAQLVGSTGPVTGKNAAAIAPLDGTSTAVDTYLNVLWDDADHNGGTMTVTGTVTITWVNLGDY